jgi:hypothetical protein
MLNGQTEPWHRHQSRLSRTRGKIGASAKPLFTLLFTLLGIMPLLLNTMGRPTASSA